MRDLPRVRIWMAVAFLCSCNAMPKTVEELEQLDDEALTQEAISAARSIFNDESYRPRVLAALSKRLRWTEREAKAVINREIWVGATWQQIVAALGRPKSVSRSASILGETATLHFDSYSRNVVVSIDSSGRCISWFDY